MVSVNNMYFSTLVEFLIRQKYTSVFWMFNIPVLILHAM